MAEDPQQVARDDAARAAAWTTLRQALLPPLRFAAANGYARVDRLKGFESLVDGALARARLPDAERAAVARVAQGFDEDTDERKRARVARLLALLNASATSTTMPAAPAPTTTPVTPKPAAANPKAATTQPATQPATTQPAATQPLVTKPAAAPKAAAAPKGAATPRAAPTPRAAATSPMPTKPAPTAKAPTTKPVFDTFDVPVRFLHGVGPKRALELESRGFHTAGDLLSTLPRTYEDRRARKRISELSEGSIAVVSGKVVAAGGGGFGRGRRFEAVLDDGSGVQLRLVFFNFRPNLLHGVLKPGALVTASGAVTAHGPRLTMAHPRIAAGDQALAMGGIWPVYPEVLGLHPAALARAVEAALDRLRHAPLVDPLPGAVRAEADVVGINEALLALHAPPEDIAADDLTALCTRSSAAHKRLAFEELFVLALALALRRRSSDVDKAPALPSDSSLPEETKRLLPFQPTAAQARAIAEIGRDLTSSSPMARLLQGDVGAGKTAVAAAACLHAVRAGHQALLMAPTELLAIQHGRSLAKLFGPLGVRVEVVTGSLTAKQRRLADARLRSRDIDIAIGTQALLSQGSGFARLGLCIVDEQHRFGVVQRAALREKGPFKDGQLLTPHLLVMTATPIPRSLALTVYGDLQVSVLDELPPGRTPVATTATTDTGAAFDAIDEVLAKNERAFVVYPLIEESEKLDLVAANEGFEALKHRLGPERVGLLHGKQKPAEREAAMRRFAQGEVPVLVATTVVEVGVDVPEATLIVIVHAERFGLAQLHQLRGRVGRSHRPSRCILVVGGGGRDAKMRVQALCDTNDGFRIAEEDLALRGPGDILGTRQSGLPSLAFSDLVKHAPLIELSRAIGDQIVERDPQLKDPAHEGLRRLVVERYAARLALAGAG